MLIDKSSNQYLNHFQKIVNFESFIKKSRKSQIIKQINWVGDCSGG